jgi:hypothetical protein
LVIMFLIVFFCCLCLLLNIFFSVETGLISHEFG